MRILLDESLPAELGAELRDHQTATVAEVGWSSMKNGELLQRASNEFDVFVTADQNLQYQQNLSKLPIAVVVLVASNNRIQSLRPLVSDLLLAMETLVPRTLVRIGQLAEK